jgi:late competence protein required for DNA uptake (superfamily II DNA/RNA helicase)
MAGRAPSGTLRTLDTGGHRGRTALRCSRDGYILLSHIANGQKLCPACRNCLNIGNFYCPPLMAQSRLPQNLRDELERLRKLTKDQLRNAQSLVEQLQKINEAIDVELTRPATPDPRAVKRPPIAKKPTRHR